MSEKKKPLTAADIDPRSLIRKDTFSLGDVKKTRVKVNIRKPNSQTWFCPAPNVDWHFPVDCLVTKDDREHYLVSPDLPEIVDEVLGDIQPKLLVGAITRQGDLMFWPIRLPGADGKCDTWNESALDIAKSYAGKWIRLVPNMQQGDYDVLEPVTPFPPPEWPEDPLVEFKKCYQGNKVILDADHPVLKRLRGAV